MCNSKCACLRIDINFDITLITYQVFIAVTCACRVQLQALRSLSKFDLKCTMSIFTVKSQNLLSDNFPGVVMTLESPLLPHDPETKEYLSAIQLGMSVLRAVPVEVHQRDIAVHASSHNLLGSCARVPIHLCLIKDAVSSEGFVVKSKLYNPKIYVGDGVSVNIDQALGLETPLFGLVVEATSVNGLKLGCTWLGSHIGRSKISEKSFIEYIAKPPVARETKDETFIKEAMSREIPSFTYAIKEHAPSLRAAAYATMLQNLPTHQRVHMVPYNSQQNDAISLSSSPLSSSPTSSTSTQVTCVDFVWQNKSTIDYQQLRREATVYNHLCGGGIFEDKAKLALLLSESNVIENALESYVFSSVVEFSKWCKTTSSKWKTKLWVAKTPLGNSGSGVWMLSSGNYGTVTKDIISSMGMTTSMDSRYAVVVQEYVLSPLLFRGRKLQFRIYCLVMGDMSCWMYRHGMLQFCNKQYTTITPTSSSFSDEILDDEVHITNVCRNVHNTNLFMREKPVDLVARYPQVYESMTRSLIDLVKQSTPFLLKQRSKHHFEFIGADYIVDTVTMSAKLIECNCPPNNTGSDPVGTIEDFHADLWEDIMNGFVRTPIVEKRRCETRQERLQDTVNLRISECGLFEQISLGLVNTVHNEEGMTTHTETKTETETMSGRFVETRKPSELAMNQLSWLVKEKKLAKRNLAKAMSMQ